MVKISIILPVYNAVTVVSRMIESIIYQTFTDWELVVVNDGSTDGSSVLLDEYALRDSRIRVFHKENEGVAMARQLGVDNAQGEFSIHADSDDWIESNMLELMYEKILVEGADMVITDYYIDKSNKQSVLCRQQPHSLVPVSILKDIVSGNLFGGLCHKLIRHSIYKKYNAKFYKGINYCEDVLIWAQILKSADIKIAYLDKAFYHYVVNKDSITQNITRQTYDMHVHYKAKLEEILDKKQFGCDIDKVSLCLFLEGFVNNVLTKFEVKNSYREVKRLAFQTKSPRWKLGYAMIEIGLYSVARRLLNYK